MSASAAGHGFALAAVHVAAFAGCVMSSGGEDSPDAAPLPGEDASQTVDASTDASSVDAAIDPDAAISDAAPSDPDAPIPDAAPPDAAPPDAAPPDAEPPPAELDYELLSETGLYADFDNRRLADGVIEFRPAYELWSDGAVKRRFIQLPPGQRIDTRDMGHWRFPRGTKLWKEFAHETDDGSLLLETRLIQRTGPEPDDVWMGSFVWRADDRDAELTDRGQRNVRGTSHDVPSQRRCSGCHDGEDHRILGFSAIQLSHDGPGPTLDSLADDGLLTDPPPSGESYPVPGDQVAREALGYMHANCGHCHNGQQGDTLTCWRLTGLDLRVDPTDAAVEDAGAFRTAVGQPLVRYENDDYDERIVAGDPEASALLFRMSVRDDPEADFEGHQMPPRFTEMVDERGVDAVTAWIEALGD